MKKFIVGLVLVGVILGALMSSGTVKVPSNTAQAVTMTTYDWMDHVALKSGSDVKRYTSDQYTKSIMVLDGDPCENSPWPLCCAEWVAGLAECLSLVGDCYDNCSPTDLQCHIDCAVIHEEDCVPCVEDNYSSCIFGGGGPPEDCSDYFD